jgi:hypothetical protein
MAESDNKLSRRHWVAGASTVGALAAAAAVLPRGVAPQGEAMPKVASATETSAGYRLTEHIKRYYQTTKA